MADNGTPVVDLSIDDISRFSEVGSLSNAIVNNIYGINHRQTPSAIPSNKDHYGFVFFTRPQLNMLSSNIRNNRKMIPLLTKVASSIPRAIRCLLDPRLAYGYGTGDTAYQAVTCPAVDPLEAFIPILTNQATAVSGWKDMVMPTFTSKPGAYQDAYSMPDGVVIDYTTYDVTCSFRNIRGDMVVKFFETWLLYQQLVHEGILVPYPDFITSNTRDYDTRIYRITLDESKRFVQNISASGASFPISAPIGSISDYNTEKPYNDANATTEISFRCNGFIHNDDILVKAFNDTVVAFNPNMADGNDFSSTRDSLMIKVSGDYLKAFNFRGYPRINRSTKELEWWMNKEDYENRLAQYQNVYNELL